MSIQILTGLNDPGDHPIQVGRIGVVGEGHRSIPDHFRPPDQFRWQKLPVAEQGVGMKINHEGPLPSSEESYDLF
jgi:hypothetical protein